MDHIDTVWFAVVNPHAGSGKMLSLWKNAEERLRHRGITCEYHTTGNRHHATELACSAARKGFRRFIAAGGDGTVHEMLDGIMRGIAVLQAEGMTADLSDFTLAVIPIGSGNDWIRSHGVPCDAGIAAELIADGSFAAQDIVRVISPGISGPGRKQEPSYMINIGGIGLDARICERVNLQKDAGKSGRLLYVNSLIHNLIHSKIFRVSVICDGKSFYEGKCLSIAFGIGKYSGGGFRQTPEAVMDDGLLDVTVIPPIPVSDMPRAALRLVDGSFLTQKQVLSAKARKVEVLPLDDCCEIMETDGEIIGTVPVCLEVLPSKLNVLHRG